MPGREIPVGAMVEGGERTELQRAGEGVIEEGFGLGDGIRHGVAVSEGSGDGR